MSAEVGQSAPEITLIDNERQSVALADIKGKTTVLVFFPGAFTGGCQEEACTFRDALSEYNDLGAQVYGISVDSFFVQDAFINQNNLNFPFLSDYSRKTIEDYGIAVNDFAGMPGYTTSMRAVFVIDSQGIVRYKVAVAPTEQPDFDAIKSAVSQTK
jgi:peroxiredoxin|tara:strand:- start:726 stop:1196 length:471 start_codon:yes stop_codon:yes gene_type:complete